MEMLSLGHEFKVGDSIVKLIPVDVVNNLFLLKRATQVCSHNEAMFENISSLDRLRMVRHPNVNVSPDKFLTSSPTWTKTS